MRWIRKLVVVGLAAFGAYRIYELVRERAQIAAPPVHDALDTVRTTAAKVRDDLAEAQTDIADDLKPAIALDDSGGDQGSGPSPSAPEPRMAVSDSHGDRASNTG